MKIISVFSFRFVGYLLNTIYWQPVADWDCTVGLLGEH